MPPSVPRQRLPLARGDGCGPSAQRQQRTIALAEALRHLSHDLHPGVLQHAGLVAALKAHCAEFESQHATAVTLTAAAGLEAIPQAIALCLYCSPMTTPF
jgi:signal transduction histidine kinase